VQVFGVSDKRYAWLKVRVLAEGRDWEGLEVFAGERKSHPIGWEVFLEAAKTGNAPREYVMR
jgi:vacuolar protein sorting-associated protein 16